MFRNVFGRPAHGHSPVQDHKPSVFIRIHLWLPCFFIGVTLCRTASKRQMEPAVAALSDSTRPGMGVRTRALAADSSAGESPAPSAPTRKAHGPGRAVSPGDAFPPRPRAVEPPRH